MHDQRSAGRHVATELAFVAMRHVGLHQVEQAEAVGRRARVGVGGHLDGVAAGRQALHVVALHAAQREAGDITQRPAQPQVGRAGLRIEQDHPLLAQGEGVAVDVAGAGDRGVDPVAGQDRQRGHAVGAHDDRAAACGGVVALAGQVQHVAAALGERHAPGVVAVVVAVAGGHCLAVGADQLPVVVVARGQAGVDLQGLALDAVELPGLRLLSLRQCDRGRHAQRQRRQAGHVLDQRMPAAGVVAHGADPQLVAAGAQVHHALDVAARQFGLADQRGRFVQPHQGGLVVVASDVEPEPGGLRQREAVARFVVTAHQRGVQRRAQAVVGHRGGGTAQREGLTAGQPVVGHHARQHQGVGAGLGGIDGNAGHVGVPPGTAHARIEHLGAGGVVHLDPITSSIRGLCRGGEVVALPGFQRQLQHLVGGAVGEAQGGRGVERQGPHVGIHAQRHGETVVGGRRAVVAAALHAQRVASGAQAVHLGAAVGQHTQRLAVGVVEVVVLGTAGAGQRIDRHHGRAGQLEAVLQLLVRQHETSAHGLACHHALRRLGRGDQVKAQRGTTRRGGGVARHGQQVAAVARHVQLRCAGAGRIARAQQHAAGVVQAPEVAVAGAGQAAQVGVDIGVQRQVEQLVGIVGGQVDGHGVVGRERHRRAGVAQREPRLAAAATEAEAVAARRQPAHRQLPAAIGVVVEGTAEAARRLDAARAGQRPVLPVARLPFQRHPAVGGQVELRAQVGGCPVDGFPQRDHLPHRNRRRAGGTRGTQLRQAGQGITDALQAQHHRAIGRDRDSAGRRRLAGPAHALAIGVEPFDLPIAVVTTVELQAQAVAGQRVDREHAAFADGQAGQVGCGANGQRQGRGQRLQAQRHRRCLVVVTAALDGQRVVTRQQPLRLRGITQVAAIEEVAAGDAQAELQVVVGRAGRQQPGAGRGDVETDGVTARHVEVDRLHLGRCQGAEVDRLRQGGSLALDQQIDATVAAQVTAGAVPRHQQRVAARLQRAAESWRRAFGGNGADAAVHHLAPRIDQPPEVATASRQARLQCKAFTRRHPDVDERNLRIAGQRQRQVAIDRQGLRLGAVAQREGHA